jgi:murein L,D-transpeptidase YcbB/YkuD
MRITALRRRNSGFVPVLLLFAICAAAAAEAPVVTGKPGPQYQRLERALHDYQRIADAGGWPSVPAGPTITPGSNDLRLAVLARRLAITGDLENDGNSTNEYDDDLQAAVLRFQSRHGLEADALVGPATLRELNVPVDARIGQIRLNLERTKKIFTAARKNFLLINVPAFESQLIRGAETFWKARVIVGDTDAETPLFESEIGHVVLNPTWTVPRSIASEELLPKIRSDPEFLARGAYGLFAGDGSPVDPTSVDWEALDRNNFPYTLVQEPGPANELGRVKLLLPNEYGVCIHDTPARYLFAYGSRAFSHGCIRMGNPIEFAMVLLGQQGWSREQFDDQLASMKTVTIELERPLPVVVAYLTAAVDKAGTVYFFADIYGKDADR